MSIVETMELGSDTIAFRRSLTAVGSMVVLEVGRRGSAEVLWAFDSDQVSRVRKSVIVGSVLLGFYLMTGLALATRAPMGMKPSGIYRRVFVVSTRRMISLCIEVCQSARLGPWIAVE